MDRKVLPPQHQVFINFRGDELRNNFISHLVDALRRNTINVFIDKEEKKGEDINNLFKRIEESKIAVAVFSRRYTESRWCLDELVKMKERADLGKLKIFPIFYNVTTYDVKLREGDFGIHFRRLKREYRSEQHRVGKWKEALACVSGKTGLTFNDKSLSESDFINNIVKEIMILLQAIPLVEAENCLVKKLPVKGETSAMKTDSFISSKAQKGNLESPPEAKIKSFSGSNSLAPHEAIVSGLGPTPTEASLCRLKYGPHKPCKKWLEFDENIKKSRLNKQKYSNDKSFTGSNSVAPHEAIAPGQGPTPETSRITLKPRGETPEICILFDKNMEKSRLNKQKYSNGSS